MSRSLGVLSLDLVLNLSGFKQGMDRAARESERGAKRIQSNLAGLQRSFSAVGSTLRGFGVGFSVTAVTHALIDATAEAIEFGDEIGKAMDKTGLGAEDMSELAAVAKQSEVELSTLTLALRNMQVVISDSVDPTSAAAKALKDLGLSFKDLQDLETDEQFELIAQRISEFAKESDQAALRTDIFKKAGEGIAPVMERGARGIREAREEIRRLGGTLSGEQQQALEDADQAIDDLTTAYDAFKRSAAAAISPGLIDFFNGLTTVINDDRDALDQWMDTGARAGAALLAGAGNPIKTLIELYRQLSAAGREAQDATFAPIEITATPIGTRRRAPDDSGAAKKAASEAAQARKTIDDLVLSLEQQASVTGETEEATIRYRIAFGDLVDDFKKAGPAFEERKQQLIDAAAAADQFKAGEELRKANEAITQQVIELQAQRIALDDGAAAAFEYRAQHGELAKTLDLATSSQNELTDAILEGANAAANLEREQAITTFDQLIRSTEDATTAIIANKIAEEQGAVAAIRYRIAQGDLKDEADALGISLAELQTRLEAAAAKQEELTQRQAEDAASESIIPSRTKALKEYDDALAGLNRRLAEGEISQRDFDQAVKIAKKNFEEATKAIDEMSVFAEEAARNMQDAFADFLFDPFKDGLEGMLSGFADTLRRMAAEAVAAKIFEKFNIADLFKTGGGGGIFKMPDIVGIGGPIDMTKVLRGGGGLGPIDITAQKLPIPGVAAAGGEAAAATALATAITTAGTAAATAFTAAGTTAATALGTAGTAISTAIITAGTTAAAAIGAAATAGSAAGGLSEIVITATRLAEGGKVRGPGTGTSDSIPARLSAGEFVVKAEAVKQPGVERLLTQINNQTVVRGFATGGRVAAPLMAQAPWTPGKRTDEHHRTFEAHTARTALQDVHRLLREDRHSTIERLLERTAAPIIVQLRGAGSPPLGDLRRSPEDLDRLLRRLGLLHRAEGGKVLGPGTATSDSIPAWLSAGEFVVKAEAVRQPGVQKLLERLNTTTSIFRGFASGGYVYSPHVWNRTEQHFATGGVVQAMATPAANPPQTIINQALTINSPNGEVSRATQMQLTAAAARGARAADRHNN